MKRKPLLLPLLSILGLLQMGCTETSKIDQQVDAVFAHMDSTTTPGCACSVTREGNIIYENGFGIANFEYGIEITPTSIFHVASVSKHFTAMAIELLVNEGKISWDDDIRKYVPEVPDFGTTITLRQLVHHVSGIRDQWNLLYRAGWRWEADVVTQKDVLDITSRQTALNFQPEERYLYSNTGFTLLAVVVERITDKTLREFCEDRIFKPLGMSDTHFHDDHEMIVPNRAWGYASDDNGYLGYRISIPDFDVVGATSLFTTVRDLAIWDKNFYTKQVGGDEAFSRFYDQIILKNGDTLNYMHGLAEGDYRGLMTVSHGGADAGYRSNFLRFPDHDLTISVLCNFPSSNPGSLARQVAEVYLKEQMEPKSEEDEEVNELDPPDNLDLFVGVYVHPLSNNIYRIGLEEDTLVYRGGRDYKLMRTAENEYLLKGTSAKLELIAGPIGEGTARFLPDGELRYRRASWDPLLSDLRVFEGIYHSKELDTEYRFEVGDSTLVFHHRKMESASLESLFRNAFRLNGATLAFSENKSSFTLSDGRVWNVLFEKME